MIRKLALLAGLLVLIAASGLGAPKPVYAACAATCKKECSNWYQFCRTHPGATYTSCWFTRDCNVLCLSCCEHDECTL